MSEFSVALQPKYRMLISTRLQRVPRAVAGNYENMTIRLNVDYYSRNLIQKPMIPVSVDARAYLAFRKEKLLERAIAEGGFRLLEAPNEKRRRGLGISVALPKRLDRIFGEGGAGLKVAGYRRIKFAGRSQWTDASESDIYRQNKFPSLRMEQISRFEITGTIGSKISVKVSQDSQTDIPLANRIQIRYRGDEDDILKSIEAGNTTLSLPNTQFVGYSSRIRGLFGVKAEAQVGQLYLTAIASQEKGSTERSTFTATGEENADFIRDYYYQERRIFDLGLPGELLPGDSIQILKIFETISTSTPDLEAIEANMWVNPDDTGAFEGEDIRTDGEVKVKEIDGEHFEYFRDASRGLHYVVFKQPRDKTKHLGYWMEVKRTDGSIDTVGNTSTQPFDLKLLCLAATDARPYHHTWNLMWRNCYTIPRNISIEDIRVKIFKGIAGTETTSANRDYQTSANKSVKYIEILGLDQYNESDDKTPDGLLDDRQEVFRPDWGLLIFPNRKPFASVATFTSDAGVTTPPLEDTVQAIYDYVSEQVKREASEYYIQLTTSVRSTRIKLDRANIIEGSEVITLDGQQLARDTDYQINYEMGLITLLNERATDPNANLSIDYEYAPFFALQKKTLLGARAEYEWSRDFKFGSTFLFKSDKTQERKPKVGQETARTIILDGDINLKLHPNFLTKVADAIPLVETETPSNMSIIAEVAQSRPNPNVDGVAYVDDFETALEELSLGTTRTRWKPTSRPYQLDGADFSNVVAAKMLWHSPREYVAVDEIYDRETAKGEGTIRTLRLIFRPDPTGQPSWAGVMRYLGSILDAKRAQLFEVRLKKVDADDFNSKLHFDFGIISEDLNGDGYAFTEDTNDNMAVSSDEDVGLDGLRDDQEPGYDPVTNPDPNGDNWYSLGDGKCPFGNACDDINWESDQWYYEFLNGTEGNIRDPSVAGIPDAENLSRGASGMERNNVYFSFSLDLGSDRFLVPNSEKNGWVTYRIPIRDSAAVDGLISDTEGEPDWSNIKHVRVWFESGLGQTDHDTLQIADWYFVQSNWQDSLIYGPDTLASNTKFVVAEMSEDVNADFEPPPGVEAYTDPTTDVTEAQRALLMDFENLRVSDSCLATKDLLTVDRYSGYRRLEMFVYGDYDDPMDEGKIEFFFRIGQDPNNYYEYYTRVYEGWDERNYVNIDFNDITALKDRAQKELESGLDVNFDDGLHYRILGNPDINKVRYFVAGLINADTSPTPGEISGQLWLDELRVTEVRRDVGTAGRIQVNGNIADLINYTFSFESRDPYFRGLSTSTRGGSTNNLGSGRTNTNYTYGMTFNANKFLPRSWGAQLPVTLRYSKSIQTPLLRNNSDIVLPEEVRKEEQSVRESRSLSVTAKFNRKGWSPLFSLLLNRLRTSFSYQRSDSRTVTVPYSFGENYNIRSSFDFTIENVPKVPIFFWTKPIPLLKKLADSRMALYPETWTSGGDFRRSLAISDDINLNRRSSNKRTFDGRMDMKYKLFTNLSFNYAFNTKRDLSDPDLVRFSLTNPKLGLETNYGQTFSSSYNPKLVTFLKTTFSYRATYSDDWQRSYEARRAAMSRSFGVSGNFDHQQLIGKKKKTGRRRRPPTRRGDSPTGRDDESFTEKALNMLRLVTGWIDPFGYSYATSYTNSLPGIRSRPNWKYRFGLRREAEVDAVPAVVGAESAGETKRYEISSGFTFLGGVVTGVKYGRAISTDLIKQGTRNESVSTSWPDLTIRIRQFTKFPLIKKYLNKFIEIFTPRTGYTRQVRETFNLDQGFLVSSSVSRKHKPLLQLTFRAFRALSLSASYHLETNTKENRNSTTGSVQSLTRSTRRQLGATAKYSVTAPNGISLPIFGRVKFNSTLDLEMSVRYNSDVSETSQSGGPFATSKDRSDIMIAPNIQYTFSRQMKGGLTMRWQDSNDNYRSRKSHIREVEIWTEISF
ncbi:MAG: cell surface protein SprA [Candidatus Zixiibacteriota bacterium]|nr:MAG: cell surface protein SprA [candidate division Zixibacteria bacterium]